MTDTSSAELLLDWKNMLACGWGKRGPRGEEAGTKMETGHECDRAENTAENGRAVRGWVCVCVRWARHECDRAGWGA